MTTDYAALLASARATLLARRQEEAATRTAAGHALVSSLQASAALAAAAGPPPPAVAAVDGDAYLRPSPNEAAAAVAKSTAEWRAARLQQVRAQEALRASLVRDAYAEKTALLRADREARAQALAAEANAARAKVLEDELEQHSQRLGKAHQNAALEVRRAVAREGNELKAALAAYDAQQERYLAALERLRGSKAAQSARARAAAQRRELVKDIEAQRAAAAAAAGARRREVAAAEAGAVVPDLPRDPMAAILAGKPSRALVPDPALKYAVTRFNAAPLVPDVTLPPEAKPAVAPRPRETAFDAAERVRTTVRAEASKAEDRARARGDAAMAKETRARRNHATEELLVAAEREDRKRKVAATVNRARSLVAQGGHKLRSGVTDIDERRKHAELEAAFEDMFVPSASPPQGKVDALGALVWQEAAPGVELPRPFSPTPTPAPDPALAFGSPTRDSPIKTDLRDAVDAYKTAREDAVRADMAGSPSADPNNADARTVHKPLDLLRFVRETAYDVDDTGFEASPSHLARLQETLVRALPAVSAEALTYSPSKVQILASTAEIGSPAWNPVMDALAAGRLPSPKMDTPEKMTMASPFAVTPLSPSPSPEDAATAGRDGDNEQPASPVASPTKMQTSASSIRDEFTAFRQSMTIPLGGVDLEASESVIRDVAAREEERSQVLDLLLTSMRASPKPQALDLVDPPLSPDAQARAAAKRAELEARSAARAAAVKSRADARKRSRAEQPTGAATGAATGESRQSAPRAQTRPRRAKINKREMQARTRRMVRKLPEVQARERESAKARDAKTRVERARAYDAELRKKKRSRAKEPSL
ncbi:uncharacterized protein AMSG_01182 [Thecamonas trahens ATCC 50062]|uniref:Uncharacterized protein n=1 Tax=Thecamonas trahens ATCC 50062 TaxID=461836 RepID=A0A0L0DMC1_THETB|nr:hypothetical protein AMSG_01182 [Thecamonas trahens ATCC 50062]KNC53469.1 hypothetical protein AMSG_01182 [Thecamonas trahens ATCC 50062]|eukprot:XP_013761793.1 hypothetical protein AMSG_01182 [Thecamonas trahens ATCC 50062]